MAVRTDFLKAIRQAPEDNTARVVFADWLDENHIDDLDAATAAYIRLSCLPSKARTVNAWLRDNWQRLCPNLCAGIIYPNFTRGGNRVWAIGEVVSLAYDPPYIAGVNRLNGVTIRLSFSRGFCSSIRWRIRSPISSPYDPGAYAALIRVLMSRDQPLAIYDDDL